MKTKQVTFARIITMFGNGRKDNWWIFPLVSCRIPTKNTTRVCVCVCVPFPALSSIMHFIWDVHVRIGCVWQILLMNTFVQHETVIRKLMKWGLHGTDQQDELYQMHFSASHTCPSWGFFFNWFAMQTWIPIIVLPLCLLIWWFKHLFPYFTLWPFLRRFPTDVHVRSYSSFRRFVYAWSFIAAELLYVTWSEGCVRFFSFSRTVTTTSAPKK